MGPDNDNGEFGFMKKTEGDVSQIYVWGLSTMMRTIMVMTKHIVVQNFFVVWVVIS